jgi:hypothetical protein
MIHGQPGLRRGGDAHSGRDGRYCGQVFFGDKTLLRGAQFSLHGALLQPKTRAGTNLNGKYLGKQG